MTSSTVRLVRDYPDRMRLHASAHVGRADDLDKYSLLYLRPVARRIVPSGLCS